MSEGEFIRKDDINTVLNLIDFYISNLENRIEKAFSDAKNVPIYIRFLEKTSIFKCLHMR